MTRRMKKTDKEECYRLFEQGLSNEEVAGRMQTSVKLMRYYRTEWKADCNPTEDTRTGKEIMYDMLEKGITDGKKLAEACGVTEKTIAHYKTLYRQGNLLKKECTHSYKDVLDSHLPEKEKCLTLFERGYSQSATAGLLKVRYSRVRTYRREWMEARRKKKPAAENAVTKKERPDGPNADRHMCRTCKYRGFVGSEVCCDYILLEGHRRGCRAEVCTKYKKQDRRRK